MEKIQKLEKIEDLELLQEGDAVETEAFGNIVYFTNANGSMIFVKREKTDAILRLKIPKEKIRIGDDGRVYFSGSSYTYIHNEDAGKEEYNKLQGALTN